jgi:hypothetical protein
METITPNRSNDMSATIGTDADTGETYITFDSSGRTINLTKGESDDFALRMLIEKAKGSLEKESLCKKAIDCLKELGEAFAEGDPNTITDIWFRDGEKIVIKAKELGILNANADKENPFQLFYINDNPCLPDFNEEKAKEARLCSMAIKALLDDLFQKISDAEDTFAIDKEVEHYGELIARYGDKGIGVGDTATDEAISEYLEKKLETIFDKKDITRIGYALYDVLH